MKLRDLVDDIQNRVPLYKSATLAVGGTVAMGVLLAAWGLLPFSPWALLGSVAILVATSFVVNWLMATLYNTATSTDSWLVTALILACILPPPDSVGDGAWLALAALIAMASKYVLAIRRVHIFNPAAIAAVAVGLTGLYPATWWIATPLVLPAVVVSGWLVVRKSHRYLLVGTFTAVSLVVMLINGFIAGQAASEVLLMAIASWPLVFLATIMLTEPYTLPPRSRDQLITAAIVGAVFASQLHVGWVYSTPELALVLGNIFAYMKSPRYRARLTLIKRSALSGRIREYQFKTDQPLKFTPGQYLDFTLPHARSDIRGNRRTFSIASSPAEPRLRIALKLGDPSSSFKRALEQLEPGQSLMAGQLAGTFVLPADLGQKLVFIAGGIGITPFRSMVQDMLDTGVHRDIVLFYVVREQAELCYLDTFKAARKQGVVLVPLIRSLSLAQIKEYAPDIASREIYLSGPNGMVREYRRLLRDQRVPGRQIHTDYFTGY